MKKTKRNMKQRIIPVFNPCPTENLNNLFANELNVSDEIPLWTFSDIKF